MEFSLDTYIYLYAGPLRKTSVYADEAFPVQILPTYLFDIYHGSVCVISRCDSLHPHFLLPYFHPHHLCLYAVLT